MTLPPPEICRQIAACWVLLGAPDWTEADRSRLFNLMTAHGLTIIDLPQIFLAADVTAAPSRPPNDKVYQRLWKLFGQLGSDNSTIRTTARDKLGALLSKEKLGWNDFTAILVAYWADHHSPGSVASPQQETTADQANFSAFDLIRFLLEDYIVATPAQRTVIALWTLATHVYDRFEYSPQLVLISPSSGFGKTTLFKLLAQFASEARLTKHVTPASIYRRLEWHPRTSYLFDEAENQGLLDDRVLRAVLDAAFERGGTVDRAGEEFPVFFPCAYALRGETRDVPASILSRSLVIEMKLGTPRMPFDRHDPNFATARELITKWWATASLELNPEVPAILCNPPRLADRCRPLIAVADTLGCGEEARAALIELCAGLPHSDAGIEMLQDIRNVAFDRISTKALVEALRATGTAWDAWRGPNDRGRPHPLTTGELSRVLRRFGIRARNWWPTPRLPGTKSFLGYCRADFEQAWADHCSETSTAPHPSKIVTLARH